VEQFKRIYRDMTNSNKLGCGSGSSRGVDLESLEASLKQLGIEMAMPPPSHPSQTPRQSGFASDLPASPQTSGSQIPAYITARPGSPGLRPTSPPLNRRSLNGLSASSSSCPSGSATAETLLDLEAFIGVMSATLERMAGEDHLSDLFRGQAVPALDIMGQVRAPGFLSHGWTPSFNTLIQSLPLRSDVIAWLMHRDALSPQAYHRRRMLEGMLSSSPEVWQSLTQLNTSHQREAMLTQLRGSGILPTPRSPSKANPTTTGSSNHGSPLGSSGHLPYHLGSPSSRTTHAQGSRAATSHSPTRPRPVLQHAAAARGGPGVQASSLSKSADVPSVSALADHQQQQRPGTTSAIPWQRGSAGGAGHPGAAGGAGHHRIRGMMWSRGSGSSPNLGRLDNRSACPPGPGSPPCASPSRHAERFSLPYSSAAMPAAGPGSPYTFWGPPGFAGLGSKAGGGALSATVQVLTATPQLLDLKFTRPTLRLPTHAQTRSLTSIPASDKEAAHA
jgi:hypothetical protein